MKHTLPQAEFQSSLAPAAREYWEHAGLPTRGITVSHMANLLQVLQPRERLVIQTEKTPRGVVWRASTHLSDEYTACVHPEMVDAVWGLTRKIMAAYMGEPEAPIGVSTFGGRLVAARLRKAYTQATLAKLAGVTLYSLNRYETSKVRPEVVRAMRLCRILEVSHDYLEMGEGEEEIFAAAREMVAYMAMNSKGGGFR